MPVAQPFTGGYRHRSAANRAAAGPSYARAALIHGIPNSAALYDPYRDYYFPSRYQDYVFNDFHAAAGGPPPPKRRRVRSDGSTWDSGAGGNATSTSSRSLMHPPSREDDVRYGAKSAAQTRDQREPVVVEGEDAAFMSRDEIERCSPSRKDGIDSLLETQLRYSYCSYLKNLGMRLDLPQTTIGAAMVLCHRFFFRRSHACHDRFLVATAALFLSAKSEETPCLLNSVLRASCESSHELDISYYPYMHHKDWFEQYREQVIETEQKILTTLDFELEVEHPYVPLTSILNKLGLSQSILLSVAWNLVSEGVFFTRVMCSV
ncbi:cyclin-T1-5-like isoform X2 [Canna indica]|uniref:Cyclin-T1-5-like isoform X2 n=1 Tax=Canna indica TaxID=4628 RepID=A0AAQ3KDM2_9LILI|nr:cyclin-T1-5-like isoform X2 [Canna indica]